MALCTRCRTASPHLNVEAIDGIYNIYTLSCDDCGFETTMAMGSIDPGAQLSFFRAMMEPGVHRAAAA